MHQAFSPWFVSVPYIWSPFIVRFNHLRVAVAQLLDESSKVYVPGVPEDDRNALIDKALTGEDGAALYRLTTASMGTLSIRR